MCGDGPSQSHPKAASFPRDLKQQALLEGKNRQVHPHLYLPTKPEAPKQHSADIFTKHIQPQSCCSIRFQGTI